MSSLIRKPVALLCVGLASSVLAVPDQPRAAATVPGTNGRIVFESTRNGNAEIYTMNPDGTNQTRLTNHGAQDITPAWSPDGTKIAWATNRNGNFDIYLMNADGSGAVNLTGPRTNKAPDRWPGFSPDGTKLVFMSMLGGQGNFEIYTMNLDGTNLTRLTFTAGIEDCCPSWSPDGSKIVFSSKRDGNFEIYTMNADGSGQKNLTRHGNYDGTPRWSPDGTKITWRSNRSGAEIWVMNADGSNPRKLTNQAGLDRRPAFSPDGTRIALTSNRLPGGGVGDNHDIWVMNADGTAPVRLTTSAGEDIGAHWAVGSGAPPPPPPPPPPPGGPGFLTLMFGRTQWVSTDANCQPLPGAVPLDEVAQALSARGAVATGAVVVAYAREAGRLCSGFPVQYANWPDMARLRDEYGWSFVSAGKTYSDLTQLTTAQQFDKSCGSLPAFEQRGHHRAWGLFAYPNNKSNVQVQSQVVSTCFAFGRVYGPGKNFRSELGPPWFQSTLSLNGGKCNNPALACYTMTVGGGRRYAPPSTLVDLMSPGENEWNVVQAYRFVTGAQTDTAQRWHWDCTSRDWRDHWVSAVELYCLDDFLGAVDTIAPGTMIADPATVAQAWGRMP